MNQAPQGQLVPCTSCRATISINAAACPHCGQPSPLKWSIGKKLLAAALLVGVPVTLVLRACAL